MNRTGITALSVVAAAVLAAATTVPTLAAGKITIPPAATIDPNAGINAKVRDECVPDARVTELLTEQLKAAGYDVEVSKQAGAGKSLQLTITNVQGVGGGAWSGPKSMSLSGKLVENGKVIGSFNGRRTSGGGAFGAYKGTCSIIGRCAKALAKDITVWLEKPTMDARLGEM